MAEQPPPTPREARPSSPYVVRWLVTDHEATVYPGSDAVVVTTAEHTQAAERASARASRVGT
jgi:Domain of unknown function (DUF1918)